MFLKNLSAINPLTGDTNNLLWFIIAGAIALIAIAGLIVWRIILGKKNKADKSGTKPTE